MFVPVCIKVTLFPSHSSKYSTFVSADLLSAFFIAMEHEFMKVIYSYRQQRDWAKNSTPISIVPSFSVPDMLKQSLPESGGVLQTFTAVMKLTKSVYRTFSKTSGFQTFFLEAAEHLLTAVWETVPWFDCPCSVVPLCISAKQSREQGMQRGNRLNVFQWRKESTQKCWFSKGQWQPSLRECHLMPLFSPQCLPSMVCHTYPKWPQRESHL